MRTDVSTRDKNRRGAAVVEACLTLIPFLAITLGLFDFAYMLFVEQTLVHNARTAARYAAVNALSEADRLDSAKMNAFRIEIQKLALCGSDTCSSAFGISHDDVTVELRNSGSDYQVYIEIPGVSFVPLAPFSRTLSWRPIQVTLPVEDTTGAVT